MSRLLPRAFSLGASCWTCAHRLARAPVEVSHLLHEKPHRTGWLQRHMRIPTPGNGDLWVFYFFSPLWLIMSEFFCVLTSVNVTRARACSLTLSVLYLIPPAVLSGCQLLSAASRALCFRKCLISALRRLCNLSLNASGTQTQQTVF